MLGAGSKSSGQPNTCGNSTLFDMHVKGVPMTRTANVTMLQESGQQRRLQEMLPVAETLVLLSRHGHFHGTPRERRRRAQMGLGGVLRRTVETPLQERQEGSVG